MKNEPLFVRTHRFGDDRYPLFWCQTTHAWVGLSSATVYTQTEVKSFEKTADHEDHATVMCRNRKMRWYVPVQGEFEELPDTVKLKPVDEWLADIA
jgi:hypothetical protein